MLKNCKGFSVLEVICSFSITLLLITGFIPILMKIYEERTWIDYKREALLLLHNEKESFLYDDDYSFDDKKIVISSRTYLVKKQGEDQLTKLCIHWEVPWNKKGIVCGYAKK